MLTHGDWHDFTVSVLKCKEVRKIYRDHPYGLKFYCIILLLHFILHNINEVMHDINPNTVSASWTIKILTPTQNVKLITMHNSKLKHPY